jgi:hypothetical protein
MGWCWRRTAASGFGAVRTGGGQSWACHSDELPMQIGKATNWLSVWSSGGGFSHLLKKRDGSFWLMDSPDPSRTTMRLRKIDLPAGVIAVDTAAVRSRPSPKNARYGHMALCSAIVRSRTAFWSLCSSWAGGWPGRSGSDGHPWKGSGANSPGRCRSLMPQTRNRKFRKRKRGQHR